METRALGKSGVQVSVFGFGAMTFSHGGGFFGMLGTTSGDAAKHQVDLCLETGVNFFDTADGYGNGASEKILGEALGARRKDVLIATKAFFRMEDGGPNDIGGSRRHLVASCENSLRRLGTDWIDLYQLHVFDALTPLEETMRALDDLISAGKVRYIGCSNYAAWQIMKALGIAERNKFAPFVSQQIQYSLLTRDAEWELLPCGVDQGVGALIWSPLAGGYLTGKFSQDGASGSGRLTAMGQLAGMDDTRGHKIIAAVKEIASARGVSPSQVALNWVRARHGVTSVLLGARTNEQLQDNLAAASWTLTQAEIEQLDKASQVPEPYPIFTQHSYGLERNSRVFPHYEL